MFTSTEPLNPQWEETRTLCNDFLAKKTQEKNHALETLAKQADSMEENFELVAEALNGLEAQISLLQESHIDAEHEIALLKEQINTQQLPHDALSKCFNRRLCVANKCLELSLCLGAAFTNKK